jgi:hypothetical protein
MKRTTKSLIALLVLVAMCVSFCVPTFAAAEAEEHEHTCPLAGKTHSLEALGLTHEQAVDAGYFVKNVAICGEDGYSIYECVNCEEEYFLDNFVKGEDVDHVFDESKTQTVAPDCTTDGSVTKYCSRCGEYITEKIDALGHIWDREGAPENGYWVYSKNGVVVDSYYCTDGDVEADRECECGVTEHIDIVGGDHTWGDGYYVKDDAGKEMRPTCLVPGKYHVFCTKCQYAKDVDVYVDKENPADAHNWEYDVNAEGYKAPTCNTVGTAVNAVCKDCGEVAATLELATTTHDYSKEVKANDATCFEDGNTAGYKCVNCGADDPANTSVKIDKIGHKNKVVVSTVDNTCYSYTHSDDTKPAGYVVGTLVAIADAPAFDNGVNGANRGWGKVVYSCPDCDDAQYVEFIAPKEHPGFGKVVVNPTHVDMGMEVNACLRCGEYEEGTLVLTPAYSHIVTLDNVPSNMVKVDTSTEPTCTVDGTYVYKCTVCEAEGTSFTTAVTVPALGHEHEEKVVKPTCQNGGWTWMVCACGDVDKTVPGADAEGKYAYTEKDDVNGHVKVTRVTTTATCTTVGYTLEFCTQCDWKATKADGQPDYKEIPALGHANCETIETPATCGAKGHIKVVCKESWTLVDGTVVNCGEVLKDQDIKATGDHSWLHTGDDGKPIGKFIELVDPTCEEQGYSVYQCTNGDCKAESKRGTNNKASLEIVPATGHTFDEKNGFVPTKEAADKIIYPQCDGSVKKGQLQFSCDNCTATKKFDITNVNDPDYDFDLNNPLHHGDVELDTDPKKHRPGTCMNGAIVAYKCIDGCGQDFAQVLPIKDHTEYTKGTTGDTFDGVPGATDAAQAATCTEAGKYETFLCGGGCGLKYYIKDGKAIKYTDPKDAIISATDHSIATTPTCSTPVACANNCGYVANCAQDEVVDEAVAPTCTEKGLTAGSHCATCGEVLTAQTEVNANGHTLDKTLIASTCDETGHTWVECSVCYEVLYFDLYTLALGHNFVDFDATLSKEPTCIANGVYYYGCSRCDAVSEGEIIDNNNEEDVHVNAAGQKFTDSCVDVDGKVVSDFFCTNAGCGLVVVEHNEVTKIVTEDCTKYRYELKICTICNKHTTTILEPNAEHDWSAKGIYTIDGVTYGKEALINAPGYDIRYCTVCGQFELDAEGAIKRYPTYADDGIEFHYEVTNKVGVVENDGYAGRILLNIDTIAQNASVASLRLTINYNASTLKFVGGKLDAASGFAEKFDNAGKSVTFTAAENANGSVTILVEGENGAPVDIANAGFAVLEFQVKNTLGYGETFDFVVDEASNLTEAKDGENDDVLMWHIFADSVADASTVVLGKLTDDGAAIGVADFNEMINVYLAGEAGYRSEADINGDAVVDALDFNIIRHYLIGNDPVELKPVV